MIPLQVYSRKKALVLADPETASVTVEPLMFLTETITARHVSEVNVKVTVSDALAARLAQTAP